MGIKALTQKYKVDKSINYRDELFHFRFNLLVKLNRNLCAQLWYSCISVMILRPWEIYEEIYVWNA